MDFLSTISLGPSQRLSASDLKQLRDLGVESPQELLGMIQATPTAFSRLLGAQKTSLLEKTLREMVGQSVSATKMLPTKRRPTRFATGAIITGRRPRLKKPAFSLQERDRLFEELQSLRALPQTEENLERVAQIEGQLNALLEKAL